MWIIYALIASTWVYAAEKPFCFLSGTAKTGESSIGFQSLGKTIRMRFDVNNEEECRSAIEGYCRITFTDGKAKIGKNKGYFKKNSKERPKHHFVLTEGCMLETVQGEP